MKVTTKALASLLVMVMLTVSSASATSALSNNRSPINPRQDKKLARLIQRHDRKLELRASVLGMTSDELRDLMKTKPFSSIVRQHGFRTMKDFQTALLGKMKDELHRRGWSDQKINQLINRRIERMQHTN